MNPEGPRVQDRCHITTVKVSTRHSTPSSADLDPTVARLLNAVSPLEAATTKVRGSLAPSPVYHN